MEMAREDLLRLRQICAEKGRELTPQQIEDILNEVRGVVVVDRPGLVTEIKRLKDNGDSGTS
jgi:hypothetical protein